MAENPETDTSPEPSVTLQGEEVDEAAPDGRSDASPLVAMSTMMSSPIPPPDMLEQYDRLVPGAAREMLDSYLEEQKHRQEMDRRGQFLEFFYAFSGLFSGWSFAIGTLILSGVIAAAGHTQVAIAALGVSAMGVVGHLVEQRLKKARPPRQ